MKKILLTLLLAVSTLLFANEINKNFDNSEIILSEPGKVLEVTFDNSGKSYNVELFKLDEKSNSILDFDVTEDALMVNFKDYKQLLKTQHLKFLQYSSLLGIYVFYSYNSILLAHFTHPRRGMSKKGGPI